ncbi:hypothetical protein AB5I41_06325 [Sphingomonas sp. MMS24-JH45]
MPATHSAAPGPDANLPMRMASRRCIGSSCNRWRTTRRSTPSRSRSRASRASPITW